MERSANARAALRPRKSFSIVLECEGDTITFHIDTVTEFPALVLFTTRQTTGRRHSNNASRVRPVSGSAGPRRATACRFRELPRAIGR